MHFTITDPKPPYDVWAVLVDFADRLDLDDGEELTGADVTAYRLWSHDEQVDEFDLDKALRLNVDIERLGALHDLYSFPIDGPLTAQLRIPSSYDPSVDLGVVPPETIVMGPQVESPEVAQPYEVAFELHGGADGTRYAARVTVTTNKDRQHSCVVRWRVQELSLTS